VLLSIQVSVDYHQYSLGTPWKINMEPEMMVWKMIFLYNWVIFRFHVNLPGCTFLANSYSEFRAIFTHSWTPSIGDIRYVHHPVFVIFHLVGSGRILLPEGKILGEYIGGLVFAVMESGKRLDIPLHLRKWTWKSSNWKGKSSEPNLHFWGSMWIFGGVKDPIQPISTAFKKVSNSYRR